MITTVQGVLGKLPPSVRDYRIYQFVKFECNSTRDAAEEFELSQTRVRQIIARVVQFFAESAPRDGEDDPTKIGLVAAQRLAREQLEFLYRRALLGFENSQREDPYGNLIPGKVAFLAMAGRLVLWMSKLPLHAPAEFREDEEENAAEEAAANAKLDPNDPEMLQFRQEILAEFEKAKAKTAAMQEAARQKVAAESESVRRQVEAEREERRKRSLGRAAAKAPPNADCSASAVSSGETAAPAASVDAVNIPAEGTYRTFDEIKAEARRDFLRPAQAADSPKRETPPLSERLLPSDDEQPAPRTLSRKERRARQRKLRRALAKR